MREIDNMGLSETGSAQGAGGRPGWREIIAGPDERRLGQLISAGSRHSLLGLELIAPATDYLLSSKFRIDAGALQVTFRAGDAGGYRITLSLELIALDRLSTGREQRLAAAEVSLAETWHDLQVVAQQRRILIHCDGSLVASVVDHTPRMGERIALHVPPESTVIVDDVRFTPRDAEAVCYPPLEPLGERVEIPSAPGTHSRSGRLEGPSLLNWDLDESVIFGQTGRNSCVALPPAGLARWSGLPGWTTYRLDFGYASGARRKANRAVVLLQGPPGEEMSGIRLSLERHSAELATFRHGERIAATEAGYAFGPQTLRDVSLFVLEDTISLLVDGEFVLELASARPVAIDHIVFAQPEPDRPDEAGDDKDRVQLEARLDDSVIIQYAAVAALGAADAGPVLEYLLDAKEKSGLPGVQLPERAHVPVGKKPIPLQVEKYDSTVGNPKFQTQRRLEDALINPGPIPPNFAHTWALNLKNIDRFRLHFKEAALAPDDQIDIWTTNSFFRQNSQGKYVPPYPVFGTLAGSWQSHWSVDISSEPEDIEIIRGSQKDTYTRVYIKLMTSETEQYRRFVIDGFEVVAAKNPAQPSEALLLGDPLLTDSYYSGSMLQACQVKYKFVSGKQVIDGYLFETIKRWWNIANTASIPSTEKGWYLLNTYTYDDGQGFYGVTYYNERLGRIRAYLYNNGVVKNDTGFNVRFSLLGLMGQPSTVIGGTSSEFVQQFTELQGAVFPVHINPHLWSDVTIPVQDLSTAGGSPTYTPWKMHTWTAIEVPFLIPMVKQIPAVKPSPHAAKKTPWGNPYYRSLYDEKLVYKLQNAMLQIEVQPFDAGSFAGDWTGQAVGQALQVMNQSGNLIDEIADWLDTGKSIASAASEGWKKLSGFADSSKDPQNSSKPKNTSINGGQTAFNILSSVISTGIGALSGGLSAVSGVFGIVKSLFGSPTPPLEMSIKLGMQGYMKGTMLIKSTPQSIAFFLPGRFAINEAPFAFLAMDNQPWVESVLPRYDRRLGLFGYAYNPADILLHILRAGNNVPPADSGSAGFCASYSVVMPIDPDKPIQRKDLWNNPYWTHDQVSFIQRFLPAIYNPYAEITPAKPITDPMPTVRFEKLAVKDVTGVQTLNEKWIDYSYDLSWKTHITPESNDKSFPPATHYVPDGFSMRLHVYTPSKWAPYGEKFLIVPDKSYVPQLFESFTEFVKPVVTPIPGGNGIHYHSNYAQKQYEFENDDHKQWHSPQGPHPIDHAICYWRQPYFYYGRSRQRPDGSVPRARETCFLRAPCSIVVKDCGAFHLRWSPSDPAQVWKARSDNAAEPK